MAAATKALRSRESHVVSFVRPSARGGVSVQAIVDRLHPDGNPARSDIIEACRRHDGSWRAFDDDERQADRRAIRRALALVLMLLAAVATLPAVAHDIPADVRMQAFVKPEGQHLFVLLRVPLGAMNEVDMPLRGPGYLDLARADAALRVAAELWFADNLSLFEDDRRLPRPTLAMARVSLASDRSFASWEEAMAHLRGAADPAADRALLEGAALRPAARPADRVRPVAVLDRAAPGAHGPEGGDDAALPAARRRRAGLRVPRQPGPGASRPALASGGAALRRGRLPAHPRRHRPPAVHRLPGHPVSPPAAAGGHRHRVHGGALADARGRGARPRARRDSGSRRWSSG